MTDDINTFPLLTILVAAVAVIISYLLIKPIVSPTIINFPWKEEEKNHEIVILAGSYNPPHKGHLAMLEYLSRRHRQVIAVVGFNPNKKYLVSPEQRTDLLQKMLSNTTVKNVRVEVVEGYIWRYAKREGATTFFRGIRSWEKDGKDERSLQILNTWGPLLLGPLVWPIPTIYLEGNPKYNHVSSTLIRQLCSNGKEVKEALSDLVSSNEAQLVSDLYCDKEK